MNYENNLHVSPFPCLPAYTLVIGAYQYINQVELTIGKQEGQGSSYIALAWNHSFLIGVKNFQKI